MRDSVLVAAGTSCRHQVHDLAGVTAVHPAVLLRSLLEETSMDLAWISLAALIIAITLSMVTSVNVGVVSLALAWIVGVYLGGMPLAKVIGTFPVELLLKLVGVTLLFGMANINGTLERMAARAVRACRGNAGVIPIMFFFIALGLSSIGPGNIATTAIMAPMAMAVAARAAVPPFLMALMVGNGAQAGALSPFAPTGHHRQQHHGQDRPGRPRDADLPQQPDRARGGHLRRLLPLRRLAAVHASRRRAPEIAQSDQAGARADEAIVEIEPFEASTG